MLSLTCQMVRWCALSIFTCASVASRKAREEMGRVHIATRQSKG